MWMLNVQSKMKWWLYLLLVMCHSAAWMLLIYQPTEVQEPPEACYSQLIHSLTTTTPPPLLFSLSCSSLLSLTLPFFPKLSFIFPWATALSISQFLPPLTLSLSLSQALTTLLHRALFLPLALTHVHMHMHSLTETHRNCGSNHNSKQPPPHSSEAVCKCLWLALTHILI